jgi:hypothetical protein
MNLVEVIAQECSAMLVTSKSALNYPSYKGLMVSAWNTIRVVPVLLIDVTTYTVDTVLSILKLIGTLLSISKHPLIKIYFGAAIPIFVLCLIMRLKKIRDNFLNIQAQLNRRPQVSTTVATNLTGQTDIVNGVPENAYEDFQLNRFWRKIDPVTGNPVPHELVEEERIGFNSRFKSFTYLNPVIHNTIFDNLGNNMIEVDDFNIISNWRFIKQIFESKVYVKRQINYVSTVQVNINQDVRHDRNCGNIKYKNTNVDTYMISDYIFTYNYYVRDNYSATFWNIVLGPDVTLIANRKQLNINNELAMNASIVQNTFTGYDDMTAQIAIKQCIQGIQSVNLSRQAINNLVFMQEDTIKFLMHLYYYKRYTDRVSPVHFH